MSDVTAIRHITNNGHYDLLVANLEHPEDTNGPGQWLVVHNGQTLPVNMWIPWADTEEQYLNGSSQGPAHIIFTFSNDETQPFGSVSIWQSGPIVRYDAAPWVGDLHWVPNGPAVPGRSAVGGDRSVECRFHGAPNTMTINFT